MDVTCLEIALTSRGRGRGRGRGCAYSISSVITSLEEVIKIDGGNMICSETEV